ncbi:MAG: peptide-methionine (S)-S-oxide reductase MsrA [Candidatus Polarisedimenticolaceae bacterium]|nr:peptide-methionine (S)-S-oxide reductase MsrA [Candidatus Polarisedimenticolaceae bacterium]
MSKHFLNGHQLNGPFPEDLQRIQFGMGCFWGAERLFWQQQGVYVTAVGYAGGLVDAPTYEAVCSGQSGHAEVVLVVFDPKQISFETLLNLFWCWHDPTQGMRQGNDVGSQYRSAIYFYSDAQKRAIDASQKCYQQALQKAGYGQITTEVLPTPQFYLAEGYHQQYLAKNPGGYCALAGTGVAMDAAILVNAQK